MQDTASSLKPNTSTNTTQRIRLTVFHTHLNFGKAYKNNTLFQIFEENCNLENWMYEITWSSCTQLKRQYYNYATGLANDSAKAGFDESKLGRDLVRVHTGKEFLDQLDQRSRPNFGKVNLKTPFNLVNMY